VAEDRREEPALVNDGPGSIAWQRWMRALGEQERRIRIFLGLSQEELARLAGVSQGSVSRLESGRGLATPMLVVQRIAMVLSDALRPWLPLLNEPLRRDLELEPDFRPSSPAGPVPSTGDGDLAELVALYQHVPAAQRPVLLTVLRATAGVLATPAPAGDSRAAAPVRRRSARGRPARGRARRGR
jgi:transcriptional regulator with XRE-family HTH domain